MKKTRQALHFFWMLNDPAKPDRKADWHVLTAEILDLEDGSEVIIRDQRTLGSIAATAEGHNLESILGKVATEALADAEKSRADAKLSIETAEQAQLDRAEALQELAKLRAASVSALKMMEAASGMAEQRALEAVAQRDVAITERDAAIQSGNERAAALQATIEAFRADGKDAKKKK